MCVSCGARWRVHGDHSPRATPRQQSRSFYIAERAPRARAFWLSLLVFALSLCVSLSRQVSSLLALSRSAFVSAGSLAFCFRLCRRSALSALVFVEALPRLCLCSALVSAVDSAPDSALFPSHLASVTPFARRVVLYTFNRFQSTDEIFHVCKWIIYLSYRYL